MKPDAILFDWDNTLVDTWPVIHRSLNETFDEMGHGRWSIDDTKERVHKSMRDSFPEIFGNDWEKAGKIYQSNFRRIHLQMLTALPKAEETLQLVNDKDIYVAVVSNKTGENLRKEIEHIGWGKYFKKVVGATDAKNDKPSPDPVHMALDGSGIATGQHVWFVGDSLTDLECAYNSNCKPIYYGIDGDHAKYKHCKPEISFSDHHSIISYFKDL